MKVLMTGFESFGGSDVNPSGEALKLLEQRELEGVQLETRILPVTWAGAVSQLVDSLEETRPQAVIMAGQSGRTHISLEQVGVNLRRGRDNDGIEGGGKPVVPGGPPAYFSTANLEILKQALYARGIPAGISFTAGTFLCNAVLYGLLHHLEEKGLRIPALFVHVPLLPLQASRQKGRGVPPSMSLELTAAALEIVAQNLAPGSQA